MYASAHPEQLAKAIEKGIPRTLRGMIWQLMSVGVLLPLARCRDAWLTIVQVSVKES